MPPLTEGELNLDALLVIQAGSDTTSGVLAILLYYLIADRSVYKRLTAELDEYFPDGDIDNTVLDELTYLSGVINEGLRLCTPFPGLARVVPKDEAVLAGTYVPGGTIVGVPAYAQQVSGDNFWPAPKEFMPERWLPGELAKDGVTKKPAIMSFSYGKRIPIRLNLRVSLGL